MKLVEGQLCCKCHSVVRDSWVSRFISNLEVQTSLHQNSSLHCKGFFVVLIWEVGGAGELTLALGGLFIKWKVCKRV